MSDSSFQDIAYVKFKLNPARDDLKLSFDGLKGMEELGKPFFYELKLTSGTIVTDVNSIVGSTGTLSLEQTNEDKTITYLNGVVTRIASNGLVDGAYHYTIEMRPWIWLLSHVADCKIFQTKSPFDIITGVFRDAGFSDFEDKRQSSSGSTVLDYCVQYRETSYDFVMRLMEEYGIYYYFKHDSTKHTLVFADDSNSHDALSPNVPYQFDQTEHRTIRDHIWEWSSQAALLSGKFTYRDYNFTTPSVDLTAKTVKPPTYSHYTDLEIYDYPGIYDAAADGNSLTDIRMQSIAWQRETAHGYSNARKLRAGTKFTMEKHPDSGTNKSYLVTKSELQVDHAEGSAAKFSEENDSQNIDTYRVKLTTIPGDTPFRLPLKTRRPMIRGPQTAKVMGASGDEICTDQYGRIKVKFFWDRTDGEDDQKTCWIRVAHSWGGAGWGSIFIPRVGMEVVVEFLEGNPDRPLVTGVVYNATQTVPYALPANKTQSTIKSNSSTGGSGFNELRFEDKAGSEEVFFQAQKDFTKKVLNNETVTIHVDTATTVETGNHSTTVSSGNHKLDVSAGKSDITAAQSINLVVGGTSIKITPQGVEITAPKITLTGSGQISMSGGTISQTGSGSIALTAPAISLN